MIDEDYFIFHKGRSRRVINKASFKISPDSIENCIEALPFVKECVVVGVDDEENVKVPMAFIVLKEGITFSDVLPTIKDECLKELPDYEVPSYFEEIASIPYTANEKKDILKLEEMGNTLVKERKGLSRTRT